MHGQVTAEFLILTGIGVLIATVMAAQASEQMELITALSAARTGASEAVSANTYAVYPATTFDEYSRGKPELLFPGKVRVMRIEVIDEGYSATYGRRKYRLRAWLSGPPLPSQLRESLSDRVNYVCMTKTKKEKLDDVLSAFMQVGQIRASGIVSKEGLLINARTPPDVDARIFSALCSTIMGAAEAASGQMNTGAVNEISVRTEKGIIILKPAGEKAIFTALAEPDAQLGLLLFEMESRAAQVEEILKEM